MTSIYQSIPIDKRMYRENISFHSNVRLLAHAVMRTRSLIRDVVEIGVWKGKSLELMTRFKGAHQKVIGIDPFEIKNQYEEYCY